MATKQFYATGAFKYGTRMLKAGDPVELDGPNARLFTALGKISPDKPRTVRATTTPDAAPVAQSAPRKPRRKAAAKK